MMLEDITNITSRAYRKAIAKNDFQKGDVLFLLEGTMDTKPSKYSIQIDHQLHLRPNDDENCEWKFINHSCDPNSYVDTEEKKIKALKHISVGEEICFNYNTTEYVMASSFQCNCDSPKCYGEIRGFKYLSEAEKKELYIDLAEHVKKTINNS